MDNTPAERRAMYRDRLAELAEEFPDAGGPELARRLAAELNRKEQAVLAEDYLSGLAAASFLAREYRYMVSRDRQALLKSADVIHREPPRTDEEKLSIFDRVPAWKEYAPGVGNRPVLDMTRDQLASAIGVRMKRVTTDVWVIETMRKLHAGLQHADEQVKERFTDDQVASILMKTRQEMMNGRLRFRYDFDSVPSLPGPLGDARSNRGRSAPKPADD